MRAGHSPSLRTSVAWLTLLSITLVSWRVGHGWLLVRRVDAGTAVVALAFLKIRIVVLEFMEIRSAPLWMRAVCETWIIALAAAIIGLYRF